MVVMEGPADRDTRDGGRRVGSSLVRVVCWEFKRVYGWIMRVVVLKKPKKRKTEQQQQGPQQITECL